MTYLETSIANTQSFSELAPFVRNIQEGVSFCGWRYIYLSGHDGQLPIDTLSSRVRALARETLGFSEEERMIGREIERHVNRLYQESDDRVNN